MGHRPKSPGRERGPVTDLFDEPARPGGAEFPEGVPVAVLTAEPIDRLLDYTAPAGGCGAGDFVAVPLGPRRVIGVTGSPGAGKSTLVAMLAAEYTRRANEDASLGRVGVVAFDPMSPITGGALLGDRLRVDFNSLGESVFYRSLAISGEDYHALDDIITLIGGCDDPDNPPFETLFVETVGAGQNETRIRSHVDMTAVVLTPGMGDAVQMDKAGILEIADVFVCNKADHPGENELIRDLRDIAGKRPILETIATQSKGVPELLQTLRA